MFGCNAPAFPCLHLRLRNQIFCCCQVSTQTSRLTQQPGLQGSHHPAKRVRIPRAGAGQQGVFIQNFGLCADNHLSFTINPRNLAKGSKKTNSQLQWIQRAGLPAFHIARIVCVSLSSLVVGGYYGLVNDPTDSQLLRAYADDRSEAAFAELVRRHVDFVYSAARRLVGDAHLAEDVAQGVFVALAHNAAQLKDRPTVVGWLHRTAHHIASQTIRTDVRRRRREQESAAMNELLGCEADASWEHIAPHLDAVLDGLNGSDREVMLLRYFEKKTAREIAQVLGTSEDAVQKRAQRALEHLRKVLARRGVAAGATGSLAVIITANAVEAAPAGLAATFTSAALGAASPPLASILFGATKTIAMTTLQKIAVAAAVSALGGAGIYEACQAARLRAQNEALLQQQAPLVDQIQQLKSERNAGSFHGAAKPASPALSGVNNEELLRLRGEVAVLRRQAEDSSQKARTAEEKLAAALSAQAQFSGFQTAAVNAAKLVGLARRMHAGDNHNQYPTNLWEITNELGNATFNICGIDLYSFDYFNVEAFRSGHPNAVETRERIARQAPDGTWQRIYGFADGSIQIANSYDGNFDAWEKANTFIAPAPAPAN